MDEMADDMPCCPSKAPSPVDCDKCVFMAACGSVCFAGISAASRIRSRSCPIRLRFSATMPGLMVSAIRRPNIHLERLV